jgi:tetratricopeptide (TPR) repeat protein
MTRWLPTVVLFAVLSGPAFPQEVEKAKLREAVHFPSIAVKFGFGFNSKRGIVLPGDVPDFAAEIARLEKALRGDPSNASCHLQLGWLYSQIDNGKRADAESKKAIELYRMQVKAHPENARLLADLGLALKDTDMGKEAEKVVRHAVQLRPRDWYCQVALGRILTDQALAPLGEQVSDLTKLVQLLAMGKVPAEDLQKAKRLFEQAMTCFNEAALLAPQEPEVWSRRACSRLAVGFFRAGLLLMDGQAINPMAVVFSDDLLADLQRLTEVSPADYKALGIAAAFEAFVFALRNPDKIKNSKSMMEALPEKTRQSVLDKIRTLERIAGGKDRQAATGAAEVTGIIHFVAFNDPEGAEGSLRRALALNPGRELAWEMLIAGLGLADKHKECLEACLARLKHKDSARHRLLAARALADLREFDQAEEQVRLGLKQDPRDVSCNLGLAAMLLKRIDVKALEQAGRQLDVVEKLLQDSDAEYLRADYLVTRGLFIALSGDLRTAREILEGALKNDGANKRAKEALAALGQ